MVRRWMTAALAALLLVSIGLQPAAAATAPMQQPLFTDLPATHWAHDAVVKLIKAGVVSFTPGGAFRPDDPITRAELFKMVLTARRIDVAGTCAAMFYDVDCSAWYAPYAEAAYRMAIAEGVGDRLFDPLRPVTREQLFTVLVRAIGKRWAATQQSWGDVNAALSPFADRASVEPYARPALALALREGLTSGYPDKTLRPKATATRAEAAALISRVILPTDGLQTATIDGHKVVFTRSLEMVASKYTTGEADVGSVTYTGVTVRPGAVAVDPSVIPLGTLLYVEGYGYAVAVDIGGAIKGNRIDLFSWEDHGAAFNFGYQPRRVWILP
jgi:3D (Asp-Asp-Asp) domain-containing protein